MPTSRVWARLLAVEKTVVESADYDPDRQALVADVRPAAGQSNRCPICHRRCPGYDSGRRLRYWRGLDFGTTAVYLRAAPVRIRCRDHGILTAAVPWARHQSRHTIEFERQVAWLVTQCSKTAITELMRICWRTVGSILTREHAALQAGRDRLAGLRRIGIDEVSFKRGQHYLTVVVDHDTGQLVWAAEGRDKATVRAFFTELGARRCAQLTHISADGAAWIARVVAECCPQAVFCADPFHVVQWTNEALNEVRRSAWREARREAAKEPKRSRGRPPKDAPPRPASALARGLKGARFALAKNPQNLTEKQAMKLEWVTKTDPRLYRAYLLKERLRLIFTLPDAAAAEVELDAWIQWARRCRIPAFVKLQRTITEHKPRILAAIEHGLSNGPVESVNAKIRVITRMAYGFHSSRPLIALAMLQLSGMKPRLPGR